MSKHNYSQYSKKNNKPAVDATTTVSAPKIPMEIKMEPVPVSVEPIETVEITQPETSKVTIGTVVGCIKLNVRVAPNSMATVAGVLDRKSEVKIDTSKSTDEWFCVCTAAGVDGYCMRKFIELKS